MSLTVYFMSKDSLHTADHIEALRARSIAPPKWDESPQQHEKRYTIEDHLLRLPLSVTSEKYVDDDQLQIITAAAPGSAARSSASTTIAAFRSSVLLVRTCLRSGWIDMTREDYIDNQYQQKGLILVIKPLHRLRACVYSVIAVRRLQITLPTLRAKRVQGFSLLKKQTKWADKSTLHLFRSASYGLLFVTRISSQVRRNHAKCYPLNEALQLVSAASKVKLDDMLNAGKCRALVQVLSFVGTYLGMFRFILDNSPNIDGFSIRSPPGLAGCYYVLKEMCRLLRLCTQYIDDCRGLNRTCKVYTKLESMNTIKFIISDVNACLRLLAMKVEEFVGENCRDTSVGACPTPIPMSFTGKYFDHYLQLQADKDLSNFLSKLKRQRAQLPFFMRWTTPADVSNLSQPLLIARLEYHHKNLIAIEHEEIDALKHGLRVDSKNIKVLRFIGAGSYGRVEEVECFGERYAMKTISSKIENAKELIIQARLQHPHIVKLVWYATTNGDEDDDKSSISLLMELMDMGLDNYLSQRVHLKKAPLSKYPLLVVHLMLQIAEAMKFLHSQGIMHRDLKASNVLVDLSCSPDFTREGYFSIKLCDFGLAKVKEKGSKDVVNTAKVGTQYWRAPEVFGGDDADVATYSFSADVYSYAMTCYEILTGKQPYADHNKTGLKQRIMALQERPSLPEDMHPRLVRLVKQCWDGTPGTRPSFQTICRELQHIKQELIFGQEIDP